MKQFYEKTNLKNIRDKQFRIQDADKLCKEKGLQSRIID